MTNRISHFIKSLDWDWYFLAGLLRKYQIKSSNVLNTSFCVFVNSSTSIKKFMHATEALKAISPWFTQH